MSFVYMMKFQGTFQMHLLLIDVYEGFYKNKNDRIYLYLMFTGLNIYIIAKVRKCFFIDGYPELILTY